MWNFGGVGILVICVFIQRSGSQTPTISPAESNILIGMNAEFACILPSAETPISWWRQSDGEVSETKDITVGTSGSNCITSPATPPSYLECSCVSTTQFNCTVKSITRSDHREKWRCSFNDASSVAQYSSYVYIYIKVGLGEDCDNADNITCATENADCDSGSKKCQCKTNYQQTAASECVTTTTTPHPENTTCNYTECSDCCCCDDKNTRNGACGAVLAVCLCVLAVLVFCCFKGFPPKHFQGKIVLICAIIVFIAAIIGLILSAICLSKECSGSEDSCQVNNCFKGDTIAGFVMTGLSVLGTIAVVILIFLITGEPGKRQDPERHFRGNIRGAGVNAPNNPPNDTHSAGSLVSRTDIYPSLESDRTSNAPMRAQPLPPVGAKGHGRGLSANYEDGMDDMPVVSQKKSLPPIEGTGGEVAEGRKRKKKKKKNKGNDDMELSNRSDKSD